MRLFLTDIDDLAVTRRDLSELDFDGSPAEVSVSVDGGEAKTATPTRAASLDRPSETTSGDEFYDLADGLCRGPHDLTVAWDAGTAFLHVVAYHYCTLDDVLDFGDEKRQSPRQLERTHQDAFRARSVAEAVCDDLCGRTFRATRKVDPAWDGPSLVHQLRWPAPLVLTPGWTIVGDGLAKRYRRIDGSFGGTCAPSEIEYVTGSDSGAPADVRRAVAKLAASYITISRIPDRAVYESTDAGMTRYTLADEGSTGIPDVDAIFARHARKRWAVL